MVQSVGFWDQWRYMLMSLVQFKSCWLKFIHTKPICIWIFWLSCYVSIFALMVGWPTPLRKNAPPGPKRPFLMGQAYHATSRADFFWPFEKTQGIKSQKSRKKLKLKTHIFAFFLNNCTFSENMFLSILNIRCVWAWYQSI